MDRANGTRSLLSSRESLRFRRAFYRWWLLIDLFPACYLRSTGNRTGGYIDGTGDGDTGVPNVHLARSQGMRKEFLSEFPDEDVAEMWQLHTIMEFVSFCAHHAAPYGSADRCGLLTSLCLVFRPMDA